MICVRRLIADGTQCSVTHMIKKELLYSVIDRNTAVFVSQGCVSIHYLQFQIPFFADTRNPSTTFASGVTYADQFLW